MFVAYSPAVEKVDSFFAYEGAYTDRPFLNPGRYRRDNFTGNYTRRLDRQQSISFKLNVGRNDFFESRVRPSDPIIAQIHATPGYSRGFTLGLTFHLFNKGN